VEFSHADLVGACVVFHIGGNKDRLIVRLAYATRRRPFKGKVFVLHVLTHKDYDIGNGNADCGC